MTEARQALATTLYLVRHATHALVDHVLVGRLPNISLSPRGIAEAEGLAAWFARHEIELLHSSPRDRARETAAPIAAVTRLACEVAADLDEIDFGEWTGMSFEALKKDHRWRAWNSSRAIARAPGGETMVEAQSRILANIDRIRDLLPDGRAVLVSHCDVIKAALLHFLGRPLDEYGEIDVAPGSVSTVRIKNGAAEVVSVNQRGAP